MQRAAKSSRELRLQMPAPLERARVGAVGRRGEQVAASGSFKLRESVRVEAQPTPTASAAGTK